MRFCVVRTQAMWDDTVFIFASDNGPEGGPRPVGSSYPFRGRKRTVWEGGVKSVAFVRAPARLLPVGGGRRFDGLIRMRRQELTVTRSW